MHTILAIGFDYILKYWFMSCNHKDVGTLILLFSMTAGLIGTMLSVISLFGFVSLAFFSFNVEGFFDAPRAGQLGFQDPASLVMVHLIDLHHDIMFYLLAIIVFVVWMLLATIWRFEVLSGTYVSAVKSGRYITKSHNTLLEIVWVLIPAFILISIAYPSFSLLYTMHEPPAAREHITLKVIGHQWYWSYEFVNLKLLEQLRGNVIDQTINLLDEMASAQSLWFSYFKNTFLINSLFNSRVSDLDWNAPSMPEPATKGTPNVGGSSEPQKGHFSKFYERALNFQETEHLQFVFRGKCAADDPAMSLSMSFIDYYVLYSEINLGLIKGCGELSMRIMEHIENFYFEGKDLAFFCTDGIRYNQILDCREAVFCILELDPDFPAYRPEIESFFDYIRLLLIRVELEAFVAKAEQATNALLSLEALAPESVKHVAFLLNHLSFMLDEFFFTEGISNDNFFEEFNTAYSLFLSELIGLVGVDAETFLSFYEDLARDWLIMFWEVSTSTKAIMPLDLCLGETGTPCSDDGSVMESLVSFVLVLAEKKVTTKILFHKDDIRFISDVSEFYLNSPEHKDLTYVFDLFLTILHEFPDLFDSRGFTFEDMLLVVNLLTLLFETPSEEGVDIRTDLNQAVLVLLYLLPYDSNEILLSSKDIAFLALLPAGCFSPEIPEKSLRALFDLFETLVYGSGIDAEASESIALSCRRERIMAELCKSPLLSEDMECWLYWLSRQKDPKLKELNQLLTGWSHWQVILITPDSDIVTEALKRGIAKDLEAVYPLGAFNKDFSKGFTYADLLGIKWRLQVDNLFTKNSRINLTNAQLDTIFDILMLKVSNFGKNVPAIPPSTGDEGASNGPITAANIGDSVDTATSAAGTSNSTSYAFLEPALLADLKIALGSDVVIIISEDFTQLSVINLEETFFWGLVETLSLPIHKVSNYVGPVFVSNSFFDAVINKLNTEVDGDAFASGVDSFLSQVVLTVDPSDLSLLKGIRGHFLSYLSSTVCLGQPSDLLSLIVELVYNSDAPITKMGQGIALDSGSIFKTAFISSQTLTSLQLLFPLKVSKFSNNFSYLFYEFDSYMIQEEDLTFGTFRLLEVDNRVVLPVAYPVRIEITSADVLHSWAIPSLDIKMDGCPGRLNSVWVVGARAGLYYGQCSELCGIQHGFMPIVVEFVNWSEFARWLSLHWAVETEKPVDWFSVIVGWKSSK